MADGDPWTTDRTACDYVMDDGTTIRFRAVERYVAQAAIGWTPCTLPSVKPYPGRGLRHRRWLLWDAGAKQNKRSVVIATNAAYVAGVIGTTTLAVKNPATNVEDTFTLYGMEGERIRGVEQQ